MMHETRFYWFVELLVQPPKYLRYETYESRGILDPGFEFTSDPHLAMKCNKGQAETIANKYILAGLNVEAREHGFVWTKDKSDAP